MCRGACDQRLVALAERVLERVEQLCQLEAEEALGVEECDTLAPVETGDGQILLPTIKALILKFESLSLSQFQLVEKISFI